MKVSVGYGDRLKEVGTIRIVNGKIEYNLPDQYKKVFGEPFGEPKEFMKIQVGRFAHSSTIVSEKEEGDPVGIRP